MLNIAGCLVTVVSAAGLLILKKKSSSAAWSGRTIITFYHVTSTIHKRVPQHQLTSYPVAVPSSPVVHGVAGICFGLVPIVG